MVQSDRPRTYVFVDADHVRSKLIQIGVDWTEVSLSRMATPVLKWVGGQWRGGHLGLDRVFIYGALPEEPSARTEQVRHWLDRNNAELDTHVHYGRVVGRRPRQKGVDVQLAVHVLDLASRAIFDVAVLVTGDADFVPLVKAVRDHGVLVAICAFREKLSAELGEVADRVGYLPDDPAAWPAWCLPREV